MSFFDIRNHFLIIDYRLNNELYLTMENLGINKQNAKIEIRPIEQQTDAAIRFRRKPKIAFVHLSNATNDTLEINMQAFISEEVETKEWAFSAKVNVAGTGAGVGAKRGGAQHSTGNIDGNYQFVLEPHWYDK